MGQAGWRQAPNPPEVAGALGELELSRALLLSLGGDMCRVHQLRPYQGDVLDMDVFHSECGSVSADLSAWTIRDILILFAFALEIRKQKIGLEP